MCQGDPGDHQARPSSGASPCPSRQRRRARTTRWRSSASPAAHRRARPDAGGRLPRFHHRQGRQRVPDAPRRLQSPLRRRWRTRALAVDKVDRPRRWTPARPQAVPHSMRSQRRVRHPAPATTRATHASSARATRWRTCDVDAPEVQDEARAFREVEDRAALRRVASGRGRTRRRAQRRRARRIRRGAPEAPGVGEIAEDLPADAFAGAPSPRIRDSR